MKAPDVEEICLRDMQCISRDDWSPAGAGFIVQAGESASVLGTVSLGHEDEYMIGKVGLEEHFAIPETLQDSAGFVPGDYWVELSRRLLDIQDNRLRQMDDNGMEMMVLSLNAPAVQAITSPAKANAIAVLANNFLAEQVAMRPDRFQAFAALPLQDADMAAAELERCVMHLGFKEMLVNGFSQIGSPENCV